jgi:hypothetical protein
MNNATKKTTTKTAKANTKKASKPAKKKLDGSVALSRTRLVESRKETTAAKPVTPAKAKKAEAKPAAKKTSKGDTLIALISRKGGATATELQNAAGWQPHSVRGFLSAVAGKKLGLKVASAKNEAGERVYSVA